MSRSILVFVVLGLMLVTGSLLGQNVPDPTKTTELSSVALPSELDRVLRDYERAWRAGDAVALASLFAEDGFVLQSNRPPIRGRSAIQAAYEGQGGGPLRLRSLAFSAGDTIGYIIGAYGYGDASGDTGKFTLTLHRAPGEPWLIFSDMDNLNTSPKSQRVSEH
ncbi:nuclear transport factor 2 family protein [Xanthomonas sp. Sa3BUA13]|nr:MULTISPECIES: nuclear transport factor 2 family protein [Xanthomonas]MBD7922372.1 nuclear transport factor 2 family protein [Xanthomonas surreyensis]